MEESVGKLWDRWITRAAQQTYPAAAVHLHDIAPRLGLLYRAFGGDPGLKLGGAAELKHQARRHWLARVAGVGEKYALTEISETALRLPATLACFPEKNDNADLYLWLTALAGCDVAPHAPWLARNQQASMAVFAAFPGLAGVYRRLVALHLAQRPRPDSLPPSEAAVEAVIQAALQQPEQAHVLPEGAKTDAKTNYAPQPVPLWLAPVGDNFYAGTTPTAAAENPEDNAAESAKENRLGERLLRSERVELPTPKSPIILPFRAEGLPTWGEYLRINRALDDEPDPDARSTAEDMDHLSLARGGQSSKNKVKFDLDLPSPAADDLYLGDGLPLPEWDYQKLCLQPNHCRVQPMLAEQAVAQALPPELRHSAKQLRQRFAALLGQRRWRTGQHDGEEIDLDACVRQWTERHNGTVADSGLYRARLPRERELACLLLADLSLSTDSWINNTHRVIDVIREAVLLFCEALSASGDPFAVYGFSSVKRQHVRFHILKDFAAAYNDIARGRIMAIKPGYYTRIGAAIRQATRILCEQGQQRRLLLLLSDGKPNDLDQYDSRYGIEDTRMAVIEAKQLGLTPFCVTIDREAGAYLPHLFGTKGYAIVTHPNELPLRLPQLYTQLVGRNG